MLFVNSVLYLRPNDPEHIMFCIVISTFVFLATFLVSMLFAHLSYLNAKLQQANDENAKLLNGMHEGVIICKDRGDTTSPEARRAKKEELASELMYWNHSAKKTVKKYI